MHRTIRITAFILLIQTIIWVIFMGISSAPIEPDWLALDYVTWASEKGVAYLINYVNVSLLTLLVVILFTFLYSFLKEGAGPLAISGLILVPIYGIMNLVCYSIQISVVPTMAEGALIRGDSVQFISQLIQADPGSLAGYINGLAYAVLGIPSILFGMLLYRQSKRWSGALLAVNGLLCITGITGYHLGNDLLSTGTMAGGIIFLLALLGMVIEFRDPVAPKAP